MVSGQGERDQVGQEAQSTHPGAFFALTGLWGIVKTRASSGKKIIQGHSVGSLGQECPLPRGEAEPHLDFLHGASEHHA